MKMKEITELSMDELLTKRRDLRQESLHLRLQQQSGQLEQPSRFTLAAARHCQAGNSAVAARETDRKEVKLWPSKINQLQSATLRRSPSRANRLHARLERVK